MQLGWKSILAVGGQGISQSHCKDSSLQLCSGERLPHPSCCSSAEVWGSPQAPLWELFPSRSCYSWALFCKSCTTNLTQEIYPGGGIQVVAASRVRSSCKLNRVQSLCRVSWGGGLRLVDFCGLILGQSRGLVEFQALVLGSSQGQGDFSLAPFTLQHGCIKTVSGKTRPKIRLGLDTSK